MNPITGPLQGREERKGKESEGGEKPLFLSNQIKAVYKTERAIAGYLFAGMYISESY